MRRREFIALVGGAVAACPLVARAQQGKRFRRVGVLMNRAADDPEGPVRIATFLQGLQERDWTVGRNVRIDYRWGAGDTDLYRRYAQELVALAPDVLLASNTSTVRALLQVTRSVPIVFAGATDPVAGGIVASLAHPGGNVTGFSTRELGLAAKWLELLKELEPRLVRVAVLRDSSTTGGVGQLAAIQTAASTIGVELTPIDVRDAGEIERSITTFAHDPNGGLIVTGVARADTHRPLVIGLAARHRLPAIYPNSYWVSDGGLIAYGPNTVEPFHRAAEYVDRILRGEKPADLPVQAPTKYEMAINLKTAKALGLDVPPMLLARADEVIE